MKKVVVIVAGGSGQRMGTDIPKQFLTIQGKPIFIYSIDRFREAFADIEIILVLPNTYHDFASERLHEFGYDKTAFQLVDGGLTRFHSVHNGLSRVPDGAVVFIHDAVRCLLSVDLIYRCYDSCITQGSTVPVIKVKDSIRRRDPDGSTYILPREELYIVQTPQTFLGKVIREAFKQDFQPAFTDEASVLECAGGKVHLVEGEESNIKITFPDDLLFAEFKIKPSK
jgi:2-C-methyl-D-erythritol 4-phosphate cytidylyltransferase